MRTNNFAMENSIVVTSSDSVLYQRKDSRKYFFKNQTLMARCQTIDNAFPVSVRDLSPGGAFIKTDKKIKLGQEVALTIALPNNTESFKATGEVVRVSTEGIGIEFKVVFNH